MILAIGLTQRYRCVVIPELMKGVLPPGIHVATISEVKEAFATDPWRLGLFGGLRIALADLRAAHCSRVWLDGSFVTDKKRPGDYDLCWDTAGVDLGALDPVVLMTTPPRYQQSMKYRGDILPNLVERVSGKPMLEFFQQDKNTGGVKGIIELTI